MNCNRIICQTRQKTCYNNYYVQNQFTVDKFKKESADVTKRELTRLGLYDEHVRVTRYIRMRSVMEMIVVMSTHTFVRLLVQVLMCLLPSIVYGVILSGWNVVLLIAVTSIILVFDACKYYRYSKQMYMIDNSDTFYVHQIVLLYTIAAVIIVIGLYLGSVVSSNNKKCPRVRTTATEELMKELVSLEEFRAYAETRLLTPVINLFFTSTFSYYKLYIQYLLSYFITGMLYLSLVVFPPLNWFILTAYQYL